MQFLHSVFSVPHRTVLLNEAVDALEINNIRAQGIYIDGTCGCGGHSLRILKRLGVYGKLIAFDKDLQVIKIMKNVIDSRYTIVHNSFANLDVELFARGITKVDGILLDLGISSVQINNASRGFSFRLDGPLDMRMNVTCGISATEWLNTATEQEIAEVIKNYGEERFAPQIAKVLVMQRAIQPILTTQQLAMLVTQVVKKRKNGKNPATRTFQAIRIFINQELQDLEIGLNKSFQLLRQGGRLVVISFHSLEDRLVKNFMKSKVDLPQPYRKLPVYKTDLPKAHAKFVYKIKPGIAEISTNACARSAVMRVIERISYK